MTTPRPLELLTPEYVHELWNRAFWEFNAEAMCELQRHEQAISAALHAAQADREAMLAALRDTNQRLVEALVKLDAR